MKGGTIVVIDLVVRSSGDTHWLWKRMIAFLLSDHHRRLFVLCPRFLHLLLYLGLLSLWLHLWPRGFGGLNQRFEVVFEGDHR